MDATHELTVRYYVVFKEAETNFLFKPLLKKGFSHTLAITMADKICVIVDPNAMRYQIYVDPRFTAKDYAMTYVKDGCTVVYFETYTAETTSPWFSLLYCVSVVLALLGIKPSLKLLTPYQLYKHIVNKGGLLLKEDGALHIIPKNVS